MATANWKALSKDIAASKFAAEDSKPSPRGRFILNLDKQIALFKDAKAEGVRNFEVKDDEVQFTPRVGNMTVELVEGQRKYVFPSKDFVGVLESIKADTLEGAFDKQLDKIAASYSDRRKAK